MLDLHSVLLLAGLALAMVLPALPALRAEMAAGRRSPLFLGVHAAPPRGLALALSALPFILIAAIYLVASELRHAANPQDKLLPGLPQMLEASWRLAFVPDPRSGELLLLTDTLASLKRLVIGVTLAAGAGVLLGINMGLKAGVRALKLPFTTAVSMVPPLAILPILFIVFGVGEIAKIVLIFLGVFPVVALGIYLSTTQIPAEQRVKALSLGASGFGVTYRIVLPQILPRLIDMVRLSLGAAWLFLIAAEAIGADSGLGYRIFLVRRYLAMDVILPYVAWITLLSYSMDYGLRGLVRRHYGWYLKEGR